MQIPEHSPTVKRKRFLINFAFFALIFALSVALVRYALPALFPFVVAYIVTAILLPLVRLLNSKLKINKRILSVILVILFYGTIGVIVIWLLVEIAAFATDRIKDLPAFFQTQVRPFLVNLFDEIQEMIYNLDPEIETTIRIYTTDGLIVRTYTTSGQDSFQMKANADNGFYLVELSGENMKSTLRYIVK